MDFPFHGCILLPGPFSLLQLKKLLENPNEVTYILFDLPRFEQAMQKLGTREVVAQYLSPPEIQHLDRLTSAKRQREWLGGRFAAKFIAAGMIQNENIRQLSDLAVIADENGRPFIAENIKSGRAPDISISHSVDLAAAMAVNKGLCGIDIQKVSTRVIKVRERFCIPEEEEILNSFFNTSSAKDTSVLTAFWAAKEALRKAANMSSLPGFLDLELTEIREGFLHNGVHLAKFIFIWKNKNGQQIKTTEKNSVVVGLMADYALALTVRNDILS